MKGQEASQTITKISAPVIGRITESADLLRVYIKQQRKKVNQYYYDRIQPAA